MKRVFRVMAFAPASIVVGMLGYGAFGLWDAVCHPDEYAVRANALLADDRGRRTWVLNDVGNSNWCKTWAMWSMVAVILLRRVRGLRRFHNQSQTDTVSKSFVQASTK